MYLNCSDQLFDPESKTATVYENFAKKIVLGCMEGVNGTIFAYGQTSSGKTHTMVGTAEEPGIIPLAFKDILDYIGNVSNTLVLFENLTITKCAKLTCQKPEREFLLRCYCLELYNEVG